MKKPNIGLKLEAKVVEYPEITKQFVPGELGLVLDWQVTDKEGKIVSQGARKGESFTRQFMELLQAKFMQVGLQDPLQARSTSNILEDITDYAYIFDCAAPINNVAYGIIIGTGNTAPTINDYAIETIIPDADMNYSIVTFGAPAANVNVSQFTITRNFANVSGGDITVNEIALYVRAVTPQQIATGNPGIANFLWRYFMTIRDVIAPGITVHHGETLTVNYRPQVIV